jgi:uncharacterized membrane protein YdbT with pleckstrin-like domain
MAEDTLWTGRASQWTNAGVYLFALILSAAIIAAALLIFPIGPILLVLLIFPVGWAFWRWLTLRSRVYSLTSERLLIESGVFNKTTETLELYRVRDLQVDEPFILRLVGLQNIRLLTTDTSTPQVLLPALPAKAALRDKFRHHIEECRMRKRVREIDIE